jgi:hypothetical protein
LRVALYAEVDPNLVEGPAVWLAETARTLARSGCPATVLLRAPRRRDAVLSVLDPLADVTIVDPCRRGWVARSPRSQLSPGRAVALLERLDAGARFDVVLVRGRRSVRRAAASSQLGGRVAGYITDLPDAPTPVGRMRRRGLGRSLRRLPLLLCQTPEIAAYLRSAVPGADRVPIALLPPIAADEAFALSGARAPIPGEVLRLVYAGKFAPAWNTLPMTELPALLAGRGVAAELHVAGDKFLARPDRRFPARMRAALTRGGVVWRGALPRAGALEMAAAGHIGLSWRAPELDGSLELSTKLIDYGALGLPVLCNPTPMHRRLLGDGYPLFAATIDEALDAIARCAGDPAIWRHASESVRRLADGHRAAAIGAGLAAAFDEIFGAPRKPPQAAPTGPP